MVVLTQEKKRCEGELQRCMPYPWTKASLIKEVDRGSIPRLSAKSQVENRKKGMKGRSEKKKDIKPPPRSGGGANAVRWEGPRGSDGGSEARALLM